MLMKISSEKRPVMTNNLYCPRCQSSIIHGFTKSVCAMDCGYIASDGEAPFSASDVRDFKRMRAEDLMRAHLKAALDLANEWGMHYQLVGAVRRDILQEE